MPRPTASALATNDAGSYDSAQDAAIAGLRSINDSTAEFGGGVLYNPATQKYAYTLPVGSGNGEHFAARVQVPQGWQLQALYHTHPKGPESTVFSADDVDMAGQLKMPSYILPLQDNKVRKFDPASSAIVKNSRDPTRKIGRAHV